MKIILHADDVAGTSSGTQGILAAWDAGRLDGFSVFANGEALDEMRTKLLGSTIDARIMVHLNLSEGPSSSGAEVVPLLVDRKGNLRHGFGSLLVSWLTRSSGYRNEIKDQVEKEWRAQIMRVIEAISPRKLEGVDGHIHIHMLPFLFPIAARLANEFGLKSIRVVNEPFHIARNETLNFVIPSVLNIIKHIILRVCAKPARKMAREMGLNSPSFVIGVLYSGGMTKASALSAIVSAEKSAATEIEIMFHVGRATNDEIPRWDDRIDITEFNISPLRDAESDELAKLHSDLVIQGKRKFIQ